MEKNVLEFLENSQRMYGEKTAENEIVSIKKKIPKMDRNTFITVDNKVVVGFISLPNKQIKYPVINTFNDNTNTYSLCRSGDKMPWDLEGMTIYGIDSFTRVLEDNDCCGASGQIQR